MVDSSVTSQRMTERRLESLSRWRSLRRPFGNDDDDDDEDEDEVKKEDGDDGVEKTSCRSAALAAAGSAWRVVARIGIDV